MANKNSSKEIAQEELAQIRFHTKKSPNGLDYMPAKPINWFNGPNKVDIPSPGESSGFAYQVEKKKGKK